MSEHPVDQLEPAALGDTALMPGRDLLGRNHDLSTADWWSQRIAMSQAISLKRIADALQRLSGPMNAYGETLGECIQGQHERGLRGIPNP